MDREKGGTTFALHAASGICGKPRTTSALNDKVVGAECGKQLLTKALALFGSSASQSETSNYPEESVPGQPSAVLE